MGDSLSLISRISVTDFPRRLQGSARERPTRLRYPPSADPAARATGAIRCPACVRRRQCLEETVPGNPVPLFTRVSESPAQRRTLLPATLPDSPGSARNPRASQCVWPRNARETRALPETTDDRGCVVTNELIGNRTQQHYPDAAGGSRRNSYPPSLMMPGSLSKPRSKLSMRLTP